MILAQATESTWESDIWESDSTTSGSEFESSEKSFETSEESFETSEESFETSESSEEISPPIWNDSSESTLESENEEPDWWISEPESTAVSDFDSEMRGIPKNLNVKETKSEAVGEQCGLTICPIGQKCTNAFFGWCE